MFVVNRAVHDVKGLGGDGGSGTGTCVDGGLAVPGHAAPSAKVSRDGDVRDIRVMDVVAAWLWCLTAIAHRP